MRFYSPAQLADRTPRSRRFWCNLARDGQLPGSVFFPQRNSASSRVESGQWWIPEAAFFAWMRCHCAPGAVIETDSPGDRPTDARSVGELRRKVAA